VKFKKEGGREFIRAFYTSLREFVAPTFFKNKV